MTTASAADRLHGRHCATHSHTHFSNLLHLSEPRLPHQQEVTLWTLCNDQEAPTMARALLRETCHYFTMGKQAGPALWASRGLQKSTERQRWGAAASLAHRAAGWESMVVRSRASCAQSPSTGPPHTHTSPLTTPTKHISCLTTGVELMGSSPLSIPSTWLGVGSPMA